MDQSSTVPLSLAANSQMLSQSKRSPAEHSGCHRAVLVQMYSDKRVCHSVCVCACVCVCVTDTVVSECVTVCVCVCVFFSASQNCLPQATVRILFESFMDESVSPSPKSLSLSRSLSGSVRTSWCAVCV